MKLGLLGSHSTVQRQNPKSKSLLVKLGLLGLEQGAQAVAMLAGEARHPRIAKHSATTKIELAESSGEAGPCRWHEQRHRFSRRKVCEARFSSFVMYSAMSKSERELAEASDDDFSPREFGEWLESEVRRHGSLYKFVQEMREAW